MTITHHRLPLPPLSCQSVGEQEIERLIDIDMWDAVRSGIEQARWLKYRECGKALAPKARGRRPHRDDAGEKSDPALAALRQSGHDIHFSALHHVDAVLGAADR